MWKGDTRRVKYRGRHKEKEGERTKETRSTFLLEDLAYPSLSLSSFSPPPGAVAARPSYQEAATDT